MIRIPSLVRGGPSGFTLASKARSPECDEYLVQAFIIGPVWAIDLDEAVFYIELLEIAVHGNDHTPFGVGEGGYCWIFGSLSQNHS